MKQLISKLLLVFTVLFLAIGCSLDNDQKNDFAIQFLPVESVTTPEYLVQGQTYPVTMYYRRPNDCYYVSEDPYYEINGATRTVAVKAILLERANCQPIEYAAPETKAFNFQCPVTSERSFTFKFYKGTDAQGNQQFIEVVVPVRQ